MSNVKRVFVEKKGEYAVQAKGLLHEIKGYLGIKDVESVRVLIMERERSGHAGRQCVFCRVPSGTV